MLPASGLCFFTSIATATVVYWNNWRLFALATLLLLLFLEELIKPKVRLD